jgi:hypothetical protein
MVDAFTVALLLQMWFQSPSCTPGEGWEFVVGGRYLERSPRWPAGTDSPPLAPRAAVRSARSLLHLMSCKDAETWEVVEVALRRLGGEGDVWVYLVRFQEPLRVAKGSVGVTAARVLDVPVLLDGTALRPAVGSWPPRR